MVKDWKLLSPNVADVAGVLITFHSAARIFFTVTFPYPVIKRTVKCTSLYVCMPDIFIYSCQRRSIPVVFVHKCQREREMERRVCV